MIHTHMSDNFEHGLWERCWCWTGLEPAKKSKYFEILVKKYWAAISLKQSATYGSLLGIIKNTIDNLFEKNIQNSM